MTSTVTAKTTASVTEIMKALFPCASITGAPKVRTVQIIAELETTPRRIYTGAIGFSAPNRKAQFNVAIRTVLIDNRKNDAEYGVGGGVVWASTPEGEYDECLLKAKVLTEPRFEFDLFETILYTKEDGFFLLDEHLARLKASAEYFGFEWRGEAVRGVLRNAEAGLAGEPHRVKLTVDPNGFPSLEARPMEVVAGADPVRVRFARDPIDSNNVFLYHKTTYRKPCDDTLASAGDCDDVILWNERGEITESSIANIVVELNGDLFTPPVACGLLAGTFRARLLQDGKIKERVIMKHEIKEAPKVFLINSIRKWRDAKVIVA